MAGSSIGGRQARDTNRQKYGEDFYKRIGKMGGSKGKKDGAIKGFAANPQLAREAGRKGGLKSRKTKSGLLLDA